MALTYQLILLLGLSGLWVGADEDCKKDCCLVCPPGWTAHNSRCFQYVNVLKDWSDAEKDCIARGGNLASFSNNEFAFIRQFVIDKSGAKTRTWVGGYEHSYSFWSWADGRAFNFNGWAPGEPNNHNGVAEDCMEIMHAYNQAFNDAPCAVKKAFICSRAAVGFIP